MIRISVNYLKRVYVGRVCGPSMTQSFRVPFKMDHFRVKKSYNRSRNGPRPDEKAFQSRASVLLDSQQYVCGSNSIQIALQSLKIEITVIDCFLQSY